MKKCNILQKNLLLMFIFFIAPVASVSAAMMVKPSDEGDDDLQKAIAQSLLEPMKEDEDLKRAIELSLLENSRKPMVEMHKSVNQSCSLVEHFIKYNGIEIHKHLDTKNTFDLRRDDRCLIRLLNENVVVVQLPALSQRGALCGTHAFKNSEWLSGLADVNELKDFINSYLVSNEINDHAQDLMEFRETKKEYVKDNQLLWEDYKKYLGKKSMMSYEEMIKFNGGVCSKVFGLNRTILVSKNSCGGYLRSKVVCDAVERFEKAKRSHVLPDPEVFIFNTGGHWVTIRVECMSNGMVGILLVDSIWRIGGSGVFDKIACYMGWLKPFGQLFI